MKRTLALLCALVMALSVLPAISFAANDRDMVAMEDHDPVNFYVTDLDWTSVEPGATLSNAQKYFYIGISENSGMFAAGWLIGYPNAYMSVTAQSSTWSGGIIAQIGNSWDDDEAWSDKFASVANVTYVGQSGGSPKGVEGVMYINGGNYLNSGAFGGVQMGGNFHRFTVAYNVKPDKEECLYEAGVGYYLPLDLIMYEFEFMQYNAVGSPISSPNAVLDFTPWVEENYEPWFSGTDGKILVYEDDGGPVVGPTTVTEYFYVDGELWNTVTHEEGAVWDMPVYTPADGYTFSGFEMVEEHEYYGTTSIIVLTTNYYLNGELYATVNYDYGTEPVAPVYTPAAGETFSGWIYNEEDGNYYGTTDAVMVTITIVYQYQDGDVIDTVEYVVPYGTSYNYVSPVIDGYIAEPQTVAGVATENYTVHVNYALVPYYHVVIHFVDSLNMMDEIYPAIEGTYANGYVINFEYPVIDGYTYENQGMPGTHTVTGDVEIYVKYVPNEYPLTIIYQYEDGTQAAEPYNGMYLYKREYTVVSPVIEGYTADYPVVNGVMVIDGETIYVTYSANPYTITVHIVDEEGNPVGEDIVTDVPYGEEYEIDLPEIPGYVTPDNPTGTCTGDDEITVVYTVAYNPVPPTVEANKAEIRTRATEDGLKDIRFIYTVHFNDSYIVYKTNTYGPTTEYYKIVDFYSVLALETGKTTTVKGTNIYAMYEDAEGEEDMNAFLFTAVLRGVKEANWDTMITATPYITYTMGGVTETVDGSVVTNSVNGAAN